MKDFEKSAQYILEQLNGFKPQVAIILGSGLGPLADEIEQPIHIPYQNIPEFPTSTVTGHSGELVAGFLGGKAVICMKGRFHYYEGISFEQIAVPIRALKAIGCHSLLLTNAAGSLRPEMPAGELMLINDHINFSGNNPLIGKNDENIGPRFVDLTHTYDLKMQLEIKQAAEKAGIKLHSGVYLWVSGPTFETPAEIYAYKVLGADAVGMSTVPEAIIARHCDLKVAGISGITNLAAGMSPTQLSHEETLEQGALAAEKLTKLIMTLLEDQEEV